MSKSLSVTYIGTDLAEKNVSSLAFVQLLDSLISEGYTQILERQTDNLCVLVEAFTPEEASAYVLADNEKLVPISRGNDASA